MRPGQVCFHGMTLMLGIAILMLLTLNTATMSLADDQKSTRTASDSSKAESSLRANSLDTSVEQSAMKFVELHHSELAGLLASLKSMKYEEYEKGIREIDKVRRRLEILEKRDPKMHRIELEGWKLQSKIDLVLAKGVARDQHIDSASLRLLIEQRVDNQKKRLELELENIRNREKQVIDSLERLVGHEGERVEQQLSTLLKKVDNNKSKKKKTASKE
jgi:hypothetical protein